MLSPSPKFFSVVSSNEEVLRTLQIIKSSIQAHKSNSLSDIRHLSTVSFPLVCDLIRHAFYIYLMVFCILHLRNSFNHKTSAELPGLFTQHIQSTGAVVHEKPV